MVRNSVGSDAYVADEIITSRAGVRVRVGNTDAEGRMAMADVLCKVTGSDQCIIFFDAISLNFFRSINSLKKKH
jgi:leucyl aminopeptidase